MILFAKQKLRHRRRDKRMDTKGERGRGGRNWETGIDIYTLFLFFFASRTFKKIFIGVQLLYNVVLVSTVQQSLSAIRIHISPLFWISFPFRSAQTIEQSSLCYTVGSHQLSILYIVSIVYIDIYTVQFAIQQKLTQHCKATILQ